MDVMTWFKARWQEPESRAAAAALLTAGAAYLSGTASGQTFLLAAFGCISAFVFPSSSKTAGAAVTKTVPVVLAGVVALGLAGCAQNGGVAFNVNPGQFTAHDVAAASAVANSPDAPATPPAANAIDPVGYKCWGALAGPVAALNAGQALGAATAIEVARVALLEIRGGGPCSALAQPVLQAIALLPGAGNILAAAEASVS